MVQLPDRLAEDLDGCAEVESHAHRAATKSICLLAFVVQKPLVPKSRQLSSGKCPDVPCAAA